MQHPYGKAYSAFSQSCPQVWQTYTEHQFVQQIADGSLATSAFYHYLVQDYLYLIQYAKAWALGVSKAESTEEMRFCASAVHTLVDVELELHIELCATQGMDKNQILNTDEDLELIAYTRYLLAEGYNGNLLDLLAIVAPCTFGYGEIGRQLSQRQTALNNPYQKWIDTYCGQDYQDFCKQTGELIDNACVQRLGENFTHTPIWQSLCHKYRIASQLEIAFWQMGLRGKFHHYA